MIWEHIAKMHWSCRDIAGIVTEVMTDKKQWLFMAYDAETGLILETSQHEHPIDAMKMADKLKEINCALKEEETRSESQTSEGQASSQI